MSRRHHSLRVLLLVGGLTLMISGCPLKFENEPRDNTPPTTFFDFAPADTTFRNEVQFRWIGTDLDSDVVAFQYQLVDIDSLYFFTDGREGAVIRSRVPRANPRGLPPDDPNYEADRNLFVWTDRQTENFEAFSELEDGWYEFRARAIDDKGLFDDTPARKRFYVFFDDVAPIPEIVQLPPHNCGRLEQVTSHTFLIDATDASRNAITPRESLQYTCQLRAESQTACEEHLSDPFDSLHDCREDQTNCRDVVPEDGWGYFPRNDPGPIEIGDNPPFLYQDLQSANCDWRFTLRVRDPAGNIATTSCLIRRVGN